MPSWTGFGGKTLWDWLKLFIVPLVLGIVVVLFNFAENSRAELAADRLAQIEREAADRRADLDRELAKANAEAQRASDEIRAQTELEISGDRFRDEVLGTYFDRISELLLEKNLRRSGPESEVRDIARTLTLTALLQLDAVRKGLLVRFLWESNLIVGPNLVLRLGDSTPGNDEGEVVLSKADLTDAKLNGIGLRKVNLSKVNLDGADLRGSGLVGANLVKASLRATDLRDTFLRAAQLNGADLRGARLDGADLRGADLQDADLDQATLTDVVWGNTTCPDGTISASEGGSCEVHFTP